MAHWAWQQLPAQPTKYTNRDRKKNFEIRAAKSSAGRSLKKFPPSSSSDPPFTAKENLRLEAVMEEYPEELRTPPVALVSLVGCAEHHALISSYLNAERPPINTLALPDLSKIVLLLSKPIKSDPLSGDNGGILKKDWLLKHRTRVPAVAAAFFNSDHVSGDPAQWLQVCSDIENLKNVIRPKNIKLIVAVVQSSANDEITNVYYKEEGLKVKTRVEKKSFNSHELNVRCCFKVAVYAEFRRDWVEALRFYDDAYHILREMAGTTKKLPLIQCLVQIKTVAEQLHFKTSTLQFLVFAELLETSSKTITGNSNIALGTADLALSEWEFQPAYYYQFAAHYLKEKRTSLDLSLTMSETADEIDRNAESVVPSIYVGQFARLLELGDALIMQSLTDEEYTRYAFSERKRFQDSSEITAFLKKAYETFTNLKAQRMACFCGFHMAKEYFVAGDLSNAKQLLDGAVLLYRQEGWVTLLWEVLGYLRECSRKCGTVKEFVEYSLELAALPVSSDSGIQSFRRNECGPAGPASLAQREIIHKEIFELVSGETRLASVEVAFHEPMIKPGVSTLITVSLLSQLPLTVDIDELEIQFNQSECNFIITNSERPSAAISSGQKGCRVEKCSFGT
ncbi:hypothetical protein OIU78_017519 [Salix suchowensis]|nr:hypothetical protein OIU78_017519 [Salix suchowensis]